jgi:hypothetical protein
MKSVGDTLFYQSERGDSVPVVIAGTYPTGIFHGNAIMSSEDFRRLWPKEGGWEVLLMKSSRPKEAAEILQPNSNWFVFPFFIKETKLSAVERNSLPSTTGKNFPATVVLLFDSIKDSARASCV